MRISGGSLKLFGSKESELKRIGMVEGHNSSNSSEQIVSKGLFSAKTGKKGFVYDLRYTGEIDDNTFYRNTNGEQEVSLNSSCLVKDGQKYQESTGEIISISDPREQNKSLYLLCKGHNKYTVLKLKDEKMTDKQISEILSNKWFKAVNNLFSGLEITETANTKASSSSQSSRASSCNQEVTKSKDPYIIFKGVFLKKLSLILTNKLVVYKAHSLNDFELIKSLESSDDFDKALRRIFDAKNKDITEEVNSFYNDLSSSLAKDTISKVENSSQFNNLIVQVLDDYFLSNNAKSTESTGKIEITKANKSADNSSKQPQIKDNTLYVEKDTLTACIALLANPNGAVFNAVRFNYLPKENIEQIKNALAGNNNDYLNINIYNHNCTTEEILGLLKVNDNKNTKVNFHINEVGGSRDFGVDDNKKIDAFKEFLKSGCTFTTLNITGDFNDNQQQELIDCLKRATPGVISEVNMRGFSLDFDKAVELNKAIETNNIVMGKIIIDSVKILKDHIQDTNNKPSDFISNLNQTQHPKIEIKSYELPFEFWTDEKLLEKIKEISEADKKKNNSNNPNLRFKLCKEEIEASKDPTKHSIIKQLGADIYNEDGYLNIDKLPKLPSKNPSNPISNNANP